MIQYWIADAVHEASHRFCLRKAASAEADARAARVRAAQVEIETTKSTTTRAAEARPAIVFHPASVPTLL